MNQDTIVLSTCAWTLPYTRSSNADPMVTDGDIDMNISNDGATTSEPASVYISMKFEQLTRESDVIFFYRITRNCRV